MDESAYEFVAGALPPAPARVLEVGAGDGELAARLRGDGYEVLAIDPEPSGQGVEAVALRELSPQRGPFDAAVAVVSLHHVEPLAESCRALAELVRPGGVLILDEFDLDTLDQRAVEWWHDQHGAHGEATRTPQEILEHMRAHLHPLAKLVAALEPWFELGEPVRGPYLYRWELGPEWREREQERIAAGELPAVGARLCGARR